MYTYLRWDARGASTGETKGGETLPREDYQPPLERLTLTVPQVSQVSHEEQVFRRILAILSILNEGPVGETSSDLHTGHVLGAASRLK